MVSRLAFTPPPNQPFPLHSTKPLSQSTEPQSTCIPLLPPPLPPQHGPTAANTAVRASRPLAGIIAAAGCHDDHAESSYRSCTSFSQPQRVIRAIAARPKRTDAPFRTRSPPPASTSRFATGPSNPFANPSISPVAECSPCQRHWLGLARWGHRQRAPAASRPASLLLCSATGLCRGCALR